MKKTLFLLGAADPEMNRIRTILETCGLRFAYARKGADVVNPKTAYKADLPDVSQIQRLVCIECAPMLFHLNHPLEIVVIDHHREGDPGYDLGASRYWEAASVGQLVRFLQSEMPDAFAKFDFASAEEELRHIAAADHCLAVAYKGKCPGIDVEKLDRMVIKNISQETGFRPGYVKLLVWAYDRVLKDAEVVLMGDVPIFDMTSEYLGSGGYTAEYLSLRAAAMRSRRIYLCKWKDSPGEEQEKIMINGDVPPRVIEHFTKVWAPAQGLTDIYGVPKRGYAGGYLPYRT
ncbi:MAG: hypothetical protein HY457_01515 [Parcubacteria group bacterium]|nr:hypothetical protein [Parcubacteria group bacterium]